MKNRFIADARLRWMEPRDVRAVAEIERGSYLIPWGQDDFERLFIPSSGNDSLMGVVADLDGEVAGYSITTFLQFGLRVDRLAVRPQLRRRKIGGHLMSRIIRRLRGGVRNTHVRAVVCEGNLPGQLFLRSLGFRCTRIIRPAEVEQDHTIDCDVQRRALLASLGDHYYFTLRWKPAEEERLHKTIEQMEG